MPTIEEIVEKHGRFMCTPEIWFAPRIPAAKVQGAIDSYAPGLATDAVLVLVDNTVWGGCGEGMCVTREYLYAKELFASPVKVKISEIKTPNFSKDGDLYVNGSKFVQLNLIKEDSRAKLCQLILELACGVETPGGGGLPLPTVPVRLGPQECLGCGAALGYGGVCLYCGHKL